MLFVRSDLLQPCPGAVGAGEGMRDAETALGWPARAGKLVLTLALDRVADHYRLG